MFLIRLRFPSGQSVANVIRKRYGGQALSKIRKLEKLDFRCRKLRLDISFLEVCIEKGVIPNFVQFRTANRGLKKSDSYDVCQKLLLREELNIKNSKLEEETLGFIGLKRDLCYVLSSIDFLFITSLFLEKNVNCIEEIEISQNIKLSKLLEDCPRHEVSDLIFNFSSHVLTKSQESILMKGLNYALPPKSLKYENYLLNFELLFRSVKNEKSCADGEIDNLKSELRNLAHSSFKSYNRKKKKLENLTEEEHKALNELLSLDNTIIQKADKGNVVVLLDKSTYVEKMVSILNDTSKFIPMTFDKEHADLKYILEKEQEINKFLNKLVDIGSITADEKKKMNPCGSAPGILYGNCKIHKKVPIGEVPPLRPILSAIDTPQYGLAKYLVPILSPLTVNTFVIKDSFTFAADVRKQNHKLFMTSFDVDSLFTNIPLDETIDICVRKLFGRKHKFKGFTKADFKQLLQFAVKDSLLMFNGKYYIQCDGVAMGSPLGPTLANVFLCYWEETWLKKCPKQFTPIYYKRYMDDTFVLFTSADHVNKFDKYLNSRHRNMSFTYEAEQNNCLSFLDVLVSREKDAFSTSLYRKPTFSGLYTNYYSYIYEKYKKGLILCLLFRIFSFSVNWDKFHTEVKFMKKLFRKNFYPEHFIDKCIKIFLDKKISPTQVQDVQKQELKISLPFMGKFSNEVKTKISKLASEFLVNTKVTVIWNSPRKLRNLFAFKDRLPMRIRSKILYRYTCNRCNSIYLGKSKRHFLVRAYEHLGLSLRTGKRYTYNPKNLNNSTVLDHLNQSKECNGSLDNFEIIGRAKNDFFLLIKESLLIHKFKPSLNTRDKSFPLQLF